MLPPQTPCLRARSAQGREVPWETRRLNTNQASTHFSLLVSLLSSPKAATAARSAQESYWHPGCWPLARSLCFNTSLQALRVCGVPTSGGCGTRAGLPALPTLTSGHRLCLFQLLQPSVKLRLLQTISSLNISRIYAIIPSTGRIWDNLSCSEFITGEPWPLHPR